MCDKEDPSSTLGQGFRASCAFSIQHSPSKTIPALSQRPDEGSEIPASVAVKDTFNIFPDEVAWLEPINKADKCKGKVAPWVGKSFPVASNAEGLAGASTNEKVNCSGLDIPLGVLGNVSIIFRFWVVMS